MPIPRQISRDSRGGRGIHAAGTLSHQRSHTFQTRAKPCVNHGPGPCHTLAYHDLKTACALNKKKPCVVIMSQTAMTSILSNGGPGTIQSGQMVEEDPVKSFLKKYQTQLLIGAAAFIAFKLFL